MAEGIRVPYRVLVETIEQALARAGVPQPVRGIEAEVMAEADLLGVPSHGVRMLPLLLKGLREGRVNPHPSVQLLAEHAAICLLDGDYGPGRYISVRGMEQAVERARRFGVGLCLMIHTTHWGRAHAYAWRAAQMGMIGICATNAIPNMTAWGAKRPVLGNNPLAIGVPRGPGRDPIVLDMAMSQAALGKIATYRREGRAVPIGWGLDASGQPTTDPAAILASGLVLPMGEHKGAGLALMIEILTAALSGSLLSHEIVRNDQTGLDAGASKLFLAVDVASFMEPARFAQRVEDLLGYVRDGVGGEQPFLYPGERGWQARERNLKEGVPIHPQIVEQLAAEGVTFSWPQSPTPEGAEISRDGP
jgi:LDH2 family malate/lactate/ureidoglycolate dehydrogenase